MGRLKPRYPGRYVGVVDGRVVASGKDQLKVFRKAEKGIAKDKEIGIFYIPAKSAPPLLLKI
ncbi:MAG: hypothetical protein HYU97_09640 [Deltaproteobacteria bacterium]|nr:hypothetical protein [Deltaproteobacteria bacterium]